MSARTLPGFSESLPMKKKAPKVVLKPCRFTCCSIAFTFPPALLCQISGYISNLCITANHIYSNCFCLTTPLAYFQDLMIHWKLGQSQRQILDLAVLHVGACLSMISPLKTSAILSVVSIYSLAMITFSFIRASESNR